jgi:hypothetical protein
MNGIVSALLMIGAFLIYTSSISVLINSIFSIISGNNLGSPLPWGKHYYDQQGVDIHEWHRAYDVSSIQWLLFSGVVNGILATIAFCGEGMRWNNYLILPVFSQLFAIFALIARSVRRRSGIY